MVACYLPAWVDRDMTTIGMRLSEMNKFIKGGAFAKMEPAARIANYLNMYNELILRLSVIQGWRSYDTGNEVVTKACREWWDVMDEWRVYFRWQAAEEGKKLAEKGLRAGAQPRRCNCAHCTRVCATSGVSKSEA